MRDPKKNVTFVFYCYEKESADLKIRLRYDGLQQSEFFRTILKMYVDKDPLMLEVVDKIKILKSTMGLKKINKASKDYQASRTILKELGISESDKQELFDVIERNKSKYE